MAEPSEPVPPPAPDDREDPATPPAAASRPITLASARRVLSRPADRSRLHGRQVRRWLVWLTATLVVGVVVVERFSSPDCAAAERASPDAIALRICQREYQETQDPATGIRYAGLLAKLDERRTAKVAATALLGTARRADALQILGLVAIDDKQPDDAIARLEQARRLHEAEHDRAGMAHDDQLLAEIFDARAQYAQALVELAECISLARAIEDHTREYLCHLSASRTLYEAGAFDQSARELKLAEHLPVPDRDKPWLAFQRGNLYQEVIRETDHFERSKLAVREFERALALNEHANHPHLTLSIEANLATTLADFGDLGAAEHHLQALQTLDLQGEFAPTVTQIQAKIAYRRGERAKAYALNDRLYAQLDTDPSDDMVLEVAVMQARIALELSDLPSAELWAQRGTTWVERVRGAQAVADLRPWVLATHRDPYELRFIALARMGRLDDALLALDSWQGRTIVDKMARTSPGVALDLRGVAHQITELGQWLPKISSAAFATTDPRAVLATLRQIDLLGLVVADQHVWRVTAHRGALRADDLGPYDAMRKLLDGFTSHPTDPVIAAQLGAQLLPGDLLQPAEDALHVLLDGALATLPIAALRDRGKLLIEARRIVRVTRLPDVRCVPAVTDVRATVLADAQGDLEAARREAAAIAPGLHTASRVGPAATAQALFAAAGDTVLHVATHTTSGVRGGAIRLYDQDVSILEISARKLAPPLVVLAGCSSALADDPELAGSLAAAFLIAGSRQVVATTTDIGDHDAGDLTPRFYRANGTADPVRALAKVQAELAATPNTTWPYFAVFGHDSCPAPLPR